MMNDVLANYAFSPTVLSIQPFGNGHINKTYLIETTNQEKYILQEINTHVFLNPQQVMENIERVLAHLEKKASTTSNRNLEIVKTKDERSFLQTTSSTWRTYRYIVGARTYEMIESVDMFYEVGKAVGNFQAMLADFPIKMLHTTIPNFHHTPHRLHQFFDVVAHAKENQILPIQAEIEFVKKYQGIASLIQEGLDQGTIPLRVTHNDTKLNNVMMDIVTGQAKCLIDLDTVMPGSILFDYGDAIRHGASKTTEDEADLTKVGFDTLLIHAFTKGYLQEAIHFIVHSEVELLTRSIQIIALELGSRFLSDYIQGSIYFHIDYPNHNLIRARNQFQLVQCVEDQFDEIQAIILTCYEEAKKAVK
jgi:N-acetylhexosamine 1-kinase